MLDGNCSSRNLFHSFQFQVKAVQLSSLLWMRARIGCGTVPHVYFTENKISSLGRDFQSTNIKNVTFARLTQLDRLLECLLRKGSHTQLQGFVKCCATVDVQCKIRTDARYRHYSWRGSCRWTTTVRTYTPATPADMHCFLMAMLRMAPSGEQQMHIVGHKKSSLQMKNWTRIPQTICV